jgi:Gluconate 2-dehydrogenase subunit 3
MRRRDFVQAMVTLFLAPRQLWSQQTPKPTMPPPAPVPWMLGLNPKRTLPHTALADEVTGPVRHFFSAMQMATLVRLSDVLMPTINERPGAVAAETPAFLDFLIGSSPAPRQKLYGGGLYWLESAAQKQFGSAFAKLDAAQADILIKPCMRTWMSDHPPTEPHAEFLNVAHDDIRTATLNSKSWSEKQGRQDSEGLYWLPIQPDLHAAGAECSGTPPHVLAAPKAPHTMPSYPR